jgi:ferredoxin
MVIEQWDISVDGVRCIGSGLCASAAPDHFVLEVDHSVPVRGRIDAAEVVIDAAECCPMEAITVRHAADGRIIAPLG